MGYDAENMRISPLGNSDIPHLGMSPFTSKDIRATEVDKTDVAASLRPGDIVRARVISLGDSTQYFLSTAENELGVRWAKSAAGSIMIPISWQVRRVHRGALSIVLHFM